MTIKHYFDNPLKFSFSATVVEAVSNPNETTTIILDETYFYPTGGGQSHDRGTLGGFPIVNVRKADETIIHVIKGGALSGTVEGKIDESYRRGNMVAHTGQHLLSAICLRELNAKTTAVRMNATGLSTVDITTPNLKQTSIDGIEDQVNQAIWDNREVKSSFVSSDSPKLEQLRRAVKFDKVTGDVRLVEIEGIDLSACAGTHVPYTGMLGILKIVKVENYKGGSRIHFVVGAEAIAQFRIYQQTLNTVSNLLSSGIEQVVELVEKLQSERSDLAKQVATQKEHLLSYEAQSYLTKNVDTPIILTFDNRQSDDLRMLANILTKSSRSPMIIINQQEKDVMLIVATSDADAYHAGNLLRSILAEFDGQGGGRETYAQGVLKGFEDVASLRQIVDQKLNS